VDRQEGVLAVLLRDIEGDAVQVLAFDGQVFEMRKNVPADLGEFGRIIGVPI
jgi:hypothetical protein